MNVTLIISEDLGKAAKHRAVDKGMSLSKWVEELIKKDILSSKARRITLAEALENNLFGHYDKEIDFESSPMDTREISF